MVDVGRGTFVYAYHRNADEQGKVVAIVEVTDDVSLDKRVPDEFTRAVQNAQGALRKYHSTEYEVSSYEGCIEAVGGRAGIDRREYVQLRVPASLCLIYPDFIGNRIAGSKNICYVGVIEKHIIAALGKAKEDPKYACQAIEDALKEVKTLRNELRLYLNAELVEAQIHLGAIQTMKGQDKETALSMGINSLEMARSTLYGLLDR